MDCYYHLLQNITDYLVAMKSDIAQEQLRQLPEEKREYWENYIPRILPELINKKRVFSINREVYLLERMTMALLKQKNIYIDETGEIIADNYKAN